MPTQKPMKPPVIGCEPENAGTLYEAQVTELMFWTGLSRAQVLRRAVFELFEKEKRNHDNDG